MLSVLINGRNIDIIIKQCIRIAKDEKRIHSHIKIMKPLVLSDEYTNIYFPFEDDHSIIETRVKEKLKYCS